MSLKALNRIELDQRIKSLAQKERDVLHEILMTIREIDSRRTYLEFGFGSLFDYLVQGVGYSEGSAQRRIDAARLLKEIPEIAEKIQSGEIKLNQISMVQRASREVLKNTAQKVSADQKWELLNQLTKKNNTESQKEVAAYFDLPVIGVQVQKVQADESVRLELTLSKEAYEKLKQAQALLAHSVPTQDLAVFLEYVSEKVIKQKTSYRNSTVQKANKLDAENLVNATNEVQSTATVAVKALSVSVKKKVLKDQGCCQFKDPITGRICGTKWFVQTDHKHSQWAGGDHNEINLQVLCGQHNRLKFQLESGVRLK